ncbi:CusA/CzcA family heavy metal efflux RND transporter [Aequorivita antarctica]|uniref:CusA/CzcA family heavy metal efflux RND transporter n=1 Tax=Aequorivita antarctica TaxID=153266 RepID=A0A5C6YWG1_9FLAO|nr:CusA/CzcA family heavy metal efflux RND transporter [Aequorivita antarctica]TXD71954.1 CusA/CzcA family heavy metal efflux RND transporter [Aequorivita antarctica]SRX72935.1 Cobalt-zinc-cadmium resistance protein CzcA [Aequorivita antarctica]
MLSKIIQFSIKNKLIIGLFTLVLIGFGVFSLTQLSIGAVPDVTNNQVQVITTSRNLSTQDMEQFITYPVELEMANLPGVKEIRSTSKFGLSVVTIVFEENMGTYLPRQLIAEKIQSATENIPEGFGTPQMGPITTGLGEIYQYILDVKPGFEDKYSTTELRTIQDWIVKRQLSGIPGVVEVNTWGGKLKQYEVAINTHKLNAMGITAQEIFTALEKNNSVSGGGYIEKENQAYFIRGEGLASSLEDIGNIVVKNENGFPIYIKDIAKVQFGSAPRFGAITGNGEGEKILGQVMMLKDGNSNQVIEDVKKRVANIAESLPEGVYINPVLDRSVLIGKTTFTIAENLILGVLIVIFVVVLLLGNLRSGLVVASVIPLSLLFTLSLMYIFGVDANLMSLGAIDFGIIIDGAVIIVEFVAFQISKNATKLNALSSEEKQLSKDNLTVKSASKMMNSAIFGQLIILIVFIPILSLSGVEGKMFKPMALTFSFALIGAMVLCFTYVPVAASIFLKPTETSKRNISVRIMNFLNRFYEPTIRWALNTKKFVLGIAALILVATIYLFTTMGGEFVPTLDEGDFVIQPVLKTGTSLSNTIDITTNIEKILIEKFPEVDQVVSRIGAAEVPTDPMSMEESDVIVTLKPKSEWVSANSKDELADKFKEALSIIPGMEVEFTQPIEMRFNELITGVRADIAVKIFGEDLDVLNKKANEIKGVIENVDGAADITIEKIVGLPQMNVKFDRSKIARYGLNIVDLNEMIAMGFAGKSLGSIFEGEKRFDLVVRLDENNRHDLSNLQNLYVDTPSGEKVPLRELAEIKYTKGAAKISRDDTKRRIVVGINVRNRDLQSVVDDVQKLINENIKLPVGYTIDYGGQFENLQSAKSRLLIAVPVALVLIFFLLYFAFNSVKEALMIYSAIPLAAVGGVLLLWLRDMPFSISAGVGFIALFGIAVLNGIVLIEHFKELKKEGMKDKKELIVHGAKNRLRAVLLTAAAAALGFLPMAISTNAGAEVQRPLATVVIGGLVTATLLTLIVLPVLFSIFDSDKKVIKLKRKGKKLPTAIIIFLLGFSGMAQQNPKTLEGLKQMALDNNAGLKASSLQVDEADALIGSAFNFDKTTVFYEFDENNLAPNNEPLKVFGVQQGFLFPTVYFAEKSVNQRQFEMQSSQYELQKRKTEGLVAAAFYQFQFEKNRERVFQSLDSLYQNFAHAAQRRFELGETNYLEKITARAKQRQLETDYRQSREDVQIAMERLKAVVQFKDSLVISEQPLEKLQLSLPSLEEHPAIDYYQRRNDFFLAKQSLEKQHLLPDISLSYSLGSNSGLSQNLYAYQIGLKIPLFFSGNASKIKASKIAAEMSQQQAEDYKIHLNSRKVQLLNEVSKYEEGLQYYENEGKSLSEEILKTANISFKNGEIDFFQYIQSLENAYEIELQHLENLNNYNQAVIAINYLIL